MYSCVCTYTLSVYIYMYVYTHLKTGKFFVWLVCIQPHTCLPIAIKTTCIVIYDKK